MIPANHQLNGIAPEAADHVGDAAVSAGDSTGTASLEQVRDILFGSQMRDVDRRFARLEERVAKDARDLKDAIKDRLDAFELYVKRETESLANQARSEQGERADADARLGRELADAAQSFERRAAALDELLSKSQREVRQHLLDQHQRLSEDIRQKIDEVLAALAREARELRNDKTDRQALASLLKEMAMRLTGEFTLPKTADGGNG